MTSYGNFSEPGDPESLNGVSYIFIGLYMSTLSLTAIFGNCLVLFVFWRRSLYKRPVNWFIVNLAVADLSVSLFAHPMSAVAAFNQSWNLAAIGCQLYGFFTYLFACNNIMTYAAISYFRYQIVCENKYIARVKRGRVLSVLVCVWIFSLFWTVCPLAGWNAYTPEPYGVSCSLHWYGKGIGDKVYIWLVLFFVYVFPLAIMVFSYSRIARHARRLSCAPPVRNEENKSKFLYNLERGATKISLMMTITFVFTWTPYAIMSAITASGVHFLSPVMLLPTLFAKSSCAYNPFVFFLSHNTFKSYQWGFSLCVNTTTKKEAPGVFDTGTRFHNRVAPAGSTNPQQEATNDTEKKQTCSKGTILNVESAQESNVM